MHLMWDKSTTGAQDLEAFPNKINQSKPNRTQSVCKIKIILCVMYTQSFLLIQIILCTMKLLQQSFLFAMSVACAAGLNYDPAADNENSDSNRVLQIASGNGLRGCWSSFSQGGYCMEKIDDTVDTTSDKVKFLTCNAMKPAQFWKFDKTIDDSTNNLYGGLIYNMAGGCLAIRGPYVDGKNLKVLDCNRNNPRQHWLSDGDTLFPRDSKGFCVSPPSNPIKAGDIAVLRDCEDTFSLDY
jgi:hypothetical protein